MSDTVDNLDLLYLQSQGGRRGESGIMSIVGRACINITASAKESGAIHPSSSVKLPCVLGERKDLVYGEVQEIAEVTSHDFWQKYGKKDGWKSETGLTGNIDNGTVCQRAGWSEAE